MQMVASRESHLQALCTLLAQRYSDVIQASFNPAPTHGGPSLTFPSPGLFHIQQQCARTHARILTGDGGGLTHDA